MSATNQTTVSSSSPSSSGRTTRAMKAAQQGAAPNTTTSTTPAAGAAPTNASKKRTATAAEIDTTAHLTLSHHSSGKVCITSTGARHLPGAQAQENAALEKQLAAEKNKAFLWGTQLPALAAPALRSDFKVMGYSAAAIIALLARRESLLVDGFAQRPFGLAGRTVANTGPAPVRARKPVERYPELLIWAGKEWVLFDPAKERDQPLPPMPPSVARWASFVKGAPRVVLESRKSGSIILRATPVELLDRAVEYTAAGPRVENWVPVGTAEKESAPLADPEPREATPALGRGARRKRESDEMSAAPAVQTGPEVAEAAVVAAETETAAAENLAGEGKQKRRRRPGRPKMSEARVERSSSEGEVREV